MRVATGDRQAPVPWTGRPRRVDLLCWGGMSLSGLYYFALVPLRPVLLATHPILLILAGGSTEALVAGGAYASVGRASLALVLAAAIPGLMKFDLLFWWAGRLWGPRVVDMLLGRMRPGRRSRFAGFRARFARLGGPLVAVAVVVSPFLPVPTAAIFAVAGARGMSALLFLLLDLVGELAWAGLLIGLGSALGQRAVDVIGAISRYTLWISLALAALIVARVVWTTVRSSPRHPGDA
jgi:membrane protein DedA with SNARE-associated domain